MSIVNTLGKSMKAREASSGARKLAKLGIMGIGTGAVIQGFAKGASTNGELSNSLQQSIMGSSELDKSIFGKDIGVGTMMLGTKSLGFMGIQGTTLRAQTAAAGGAGFVGGAAVGAALGTIPSYALTRSKNKYAKLAGYAVRGAGAFAGGAVGSVAGYIGGKTAVVKPYMSSGMVADYNKYKNNMPYVPGDVVFGAYNTRH